MRILLAVLVLVMGCSTPRAAEPGRAQVLSLVLVAEPKLPDTTALRADLEKRVAVLRQSQGISREAPPAWLWVNFRVTNDLAKGFSLSTQGMEAFDLREIEARDVNRPGREVFGLLLGMAQYLIAKGPVIQDGETIGDSPALDIRVRQGPSYWREGATVYRVTWPR